jgi:organic hydroperoxide reductase OsmC/OhrA
MPKTGPDRAMNKIKCFAAGYAACFFDSALNLVIKHGTTSVGETGVNAKISMGQLENGGFGLAGELFVKCS